MNVDKEVMLEGFCLFRQAERSLDHVLFDDWQKLVSYYSGGREKRIREYLCQFNEVVPESGASGYHRRVLENRLKPLPRLLNSLAMLFRSDKSHSRLRQEEAAFISLTLSHLLSFLSGGRPPDADIVRLRMDASLCQDLIWMRCGPLPQLEQASMVENFDMPDHQKHYAVEEILGSLSA